MAMMNPKIAITSEENNTLQFTISDTHHSLANSLRRIILSDVPTLVFRIFPFILQILTFHMKNM